MFHFQQNRELELLASEEKEFFTNSSSLLNMSCQAQPLRRSLRIEVHYVHSAAQIKLFVVQNLDGTIPIDIGLTQ